MPGLRGRGPSSSAGVTPASVGGSAVRAPAWAAETNPPGAEGSTERARLERAAAPAALRSVGKPVAAQAVQAAPEAAESARRAGRAASPPTGVAPAGGRTAAA